MSRQFSKNNTGSLLLIVYQFSHKYAQISSICAYAQVTFKFGLYCLPKQGVSVPEYATTNQHHKTILSLIADTIMM